jgi:hypothetical protein
MPGGNMHDGKRKSYMPGGNMHDGKRKSYMPGGNMHDRELFVHAGASATFSLSTNV